MTMSSDNHRPTTTSATGSHAGCAWLVAAGIGLTVGLSGCAREPTTGPAVHGRIGPDGGIISSYDSVLTIAILPGALDTEIDFFIEPTATPPEVYGPAYRVDPNPQLHIDATVTYRFGLPDERAAIVAVDPLDYAQEEARWTLLPRIDVADKLVKARDSQISVFYGLLDDGPLLIDDGDDDDDAAETTGGLEGGPGPGPGPGGPVTDDDDNFDDDDDDDDDDNDNDNDAEAESGSTDTGSDLPCEVFQGPYDVVEFIELEGSGAEDLSFSPAGGVFATMSDNVLQAITPSLDVTPISDVFPLGITTGTRYLENGDILVAGYPQDTIFRVDGVSGAVTPMSEDPLLNGPNQIVPDMMGNLWVSSSENSRILVLDVTTGDATEFLSGNSTVGFANGLIVDWSRMRVFWTDYDGGLVKYAEFDDKMAPVGTSVELADIGGFPDGMAQDSCGYLYTVDESNQGAVPSRLIRIFIDEVGNRIGEPDEMISNLEGGLANPVFAQGAGWEDYDGHLFITGFNGVLFTVDIMVQGAPSIADPGE